MSCLPFRDVYGFGSLGFSLFCLNGTICKLQWMPYIVFNRRCIWKIFQRSVGDSCLFKRHLHISSQGKAQFRKFLIISLFHFSRSYDHKFLFPDTVKQTIKDTLPCTRIIIAEAGRAVPTTLNLCPC